MVFCILEDDVDRQLAKQCSSKDDDRKDVSAKLAKKIDVSNYCVYSTAKDNRLVVMWRRREKLKHLTRYKDCQRKLKKIDGRKHLHASRSSSISLRGVAESMKRAEEWQQWHSNLDCDSTNPYLQGGRLVLMCILKGFEGMWIKYFGQC